MYYGYDLLLKIQFRGRYGPCSELLPQVDHTAASDAAAAMEPSAPPPPPLGALCPASAANAFLQDVNEPVTRDVLVLLLFLGAMRFLVYFGLRYRTSLR